MPTVAARHEGVIGRSPGRVQHNDLMSLPESALVDESDPGDEARRLRVLFDGLPAMIGYWDSNLRNVIANEAYVEWFGVTPQQIKGMHISEIVGEKIYQQNMPYMEAALAGRPQSFERTLVDVSGATRHTQVSYSPDAPDGEVVGLFVMITDVTPRVEAQRQMDEAQQLAELGSWTANSSTGEVIWSREMYRITGHDPATFTPVAGTLPQVHEEDLERVTAAVREAGTSGVGYELTYRLVRPDGTVREVLSRVRAEQPEGGPVARLTGVLQDITSSNVLARELTRVNDQLHQVNQLNADVLGVVGHDVRQPLALVLGHLEELSATWSDSPEDVKLARVDKALGAALRLSALIDDILAMANFESGTIATRPIPVELPGVIRDALAGLHGGADVEIHADLAPVVVIDPFHLRQMIANLVSNALRYGAPPVVVAVAERDGAVFLDVTDRGPGVPEDFVPHLFDRFTRARSGIASGQQAGSGFGLYIVERLAEANGCRLTYAPGEPTGSRFSLELPTG
jgi:PAS domain S-box-containing protein